MDESIDPEHPDHRPQGLRGRPPEALPLGAIPARALAVPLAVPLATTDDPAVTAAAAGKDPSTAAGTYQPQTRTYYIGADSVPWNYAPDGKNDITGEPWDDVAGTFTRPRAGRGGPPHGKTPGPPDPP